MHGSRATVITLSTEKASTFILDDVDDAVHEKKTDARMQTGQHMDRLLTKCDHLSGLGKGVCDRTCPIQKQDVGSDTDAYLGYGVKIGVDGRVSASKTLCGRGTEVVYAGNGEWKCESAPAPAPARG